LHAETGLLSGDVKYIAALLEEQPLLRKEYFVGGEVYDNIIRINMLNNNPIKNVQHVIECLLMILHCNNI
jgi:hypothetical protein